MCGITGLIGASQSVTQELLTAMTDSIKHRGPNDSGTYINPDASVGLGHRRLSIIDLSADGREPLYNEDHSIVLVFNGEIYNFMPLRDMLLSKGHVFTSHTDAEVIIHLYEEEGIACLQKFTGMFAFALYDSRTEEIFIVRDQIGIKPLYYYQIDSLFCFGSEIRALLEHPQVHSSPDMVAITQYVTLNHVPAPRTGFENIYKLPPGNYIRYARGAMNIVQYYTRSISPFTGSYIEAKSEVWQRLVDSTKSMLVADVPLGGLLSGGVDSTAVIAAMREVSSTVQTFSIAVPGSTKDETNKAVRAAEYLETNHTVIPISITEGLNVEELVQMYEEPYADSSAVAMHLLCQNVSQHVTVALSGDGGDEVFGGYKRYLYWKYGHYFIPNFYQTIEQNFHFSSAHIKKYAAHLLPNLDEVQRSNVHSLRDVQELSFATFLPDDLLKKVDIASMRSALEVRVPFLDHHFVEFGLSLKDAWKIKGGTMKYILQDALQGKVPPELLWQKKQGFEIPVDDWFRQEVFIKKLDCIRIPGSRVQQIFPATFIEQLIAEHTTGKKNHGTRLWILLNLEIWFHTYFPQL